MKYYTIDDALKRAFKNKEAYYKTINQSFTYSLYNLTRCYIGLKPKIYYFNEVKK